MHSFQSFTADMMECSPFDKIGKEWMLVTAGNEEKVNTMTASWGGMGVMWGKNAAFIVIRQSRYTKGKSGKIIHPALMKPRKFKAQQKKQHRRKHYATASEYVW